MNMIIPFCVNMTGKTEAEIRNLHKMCINAGVNDYESSEKWCKHQGSCNYMGIDIDNDTASLSYVGSEFNGNIITLEEVPSHLGLTPSETSPLIQSPIKWTKSMQKEGTPLSVGMLALDENKTECRILYVGNLNYMVVYEGPVVEYEALIGKSKLRPFPDEETVEQKEQRVEFIHEAKAFVNKPKDIKHLFKY